MKTSDFNVSSAYVLKSDMDRCSPVDVVVYCWDMHTKTMTTIIEGLLPLHGIKSFFKYLCLQRRLGKDSHRTSYSKIQRCQNVTYGPCIRLTFSAYNSGLAAHVLVLDYSTVHQ